MVDGGGCEREASGGEYASRCAPCGVMHACIGDRAATGEAARYRCVRVVLVLVVACAIVAPLATAAWRCTHTLDIWTCCDYHTRRPISLRGRMAIWSSLENVASVLSIDTTPCRVHRPLLYKVPQYTSLAASGLKNTLALRQGSFACCFLSLNFESFGFQW